MRDLLKNSNKKYLPIETTIQGFSCFEGTVWALYISNECLYSLNLESGESVEIEVFEEVSKVKCIDDSTFIVTGYESITLATFKDGNVKVIKEFQIEDCSPRILNASKKGETIALSAYEDLIVVKNDEVKSFRFSDAQYAMAVSSNGEKIASGGENGIKIIDATSLEVIKELDVEVLPISVSFSPDDKILVYGDDRANLYTVDLESNTKTQYSNPYYSKPIYFAWLDGGTRYVVSFLSQVIGIYTIGEEEGEMIPLDEFPSRYFQYADLVDTNTLAVCVENLRTQSVIESIPTSDVVVLLKLNLDIAD